MRKRGFGKVKEKEISFSNPKKIKKSFFERKEVGRKIRMMTSFLLLFFAHFSRFVCFGFLQLCFSFCFFFLFVFFGLFGFLF